MISKKDFNGYLNNAFHLVFIHPCVVHLEIYVFNKLYFIYTYIIIIKVNQAHYDALGDVVTRHIQDVMISQYQMKEVWIPEDPQLDNSCKNNIFMSEGALEHTGTILLIASGGGNVMAGQVLNMYI